MKQVVRALLGLVVFSSAQGAGVLGSQVGSKISDSQVEIDKQSIVKDTVVQSRDVTRAGIFQQFLKDRYGDGSIDEFNHWLKDRLGNDTTLELPESDTQREFTTQGL